MKIMTKKLLEKLGASEYQIESFQLDFPGGMPITKKNLEYNRKNISCELLVREITLSSPSAWKNFKKLYLKYLSNNMDNMRQVDITEKMALMALKGENNMIDSQKIYHNSVEETDKIHAEFKKAMSEMYITVILQWAKNKKQ